MSTHFDTLQSFIAHHVKLARNIQEYVDAPKSNYVHLDGQLRQQLHERNDYWLCAGSPWARVLFAQIALDVWTELEPQLAGPFHMVTFTSPRFAIAESEAHTFDPTTHQNEITEIMAGHSFLGMTEPAYYPQWQITRDGGMGPVIAWHSHTIVSGSSRAAIEKDVANSKREESLLPGVPAVDVRAVRPDKLKSKLLYMLKTPYKQYTPYRLREAGERVDHDTGEIISVRQYSQPKRPLRTGELVKMIKVQRDKYLDELIFGNGDEYQLVTFIVEEARRQLDQEELRQTEQRLGK
ncbi:MAG: hypothetical protein JWN34_5219 [Bryobacterales bacterium]|nr:hypothetical protein [Bryobacterales bacterium]